MQRSSRSGWGKCCLQRRLIDKTGPAAAYGCRGWQYSGNRNLNAAAQPVGSMEVALAHAARLLQTAPLLAAEQAQEILKVAPGHPAASLLLTTAQRLTGRSAAPPAWLALADQLRANGDPAGADACYARHIMASTRDPRLLQAAS